MWLSNLHLECYNWSFSFAGSRRQSQVGDNPSLPSFKPRTHGLWAPACLCCSVWAMSDEPEII